MNPVIVTLGSFELRWYSVLILVGALIALFLIEKEAKRFGINKEFVFNMLFWGIIFGFIGARLYYVLFEWSYYSSHISEIFKIWEGGLAIHGGIIAALLTIIVYTKKYKVRTIRYLDFICVPVLLAQAIGRWGNFFNSEAHGVATTYEHLKSLRIPEFIINGMHIDGVYYTPTFFYESIACLILFIVLLFVRRSKYVKVGTLSALYLIGYGIIRFFIEISRTDALMIGAFKIAHIVSIIMVIVGIVILMINARKSKFEDLYNDENNIEKVRF